VFFKTVNALLKWPKTLVDIRSNVIHQFADIVR